MTENVFGFPMKVVSSEELKKSDAHFTIVVSRRADLPTSMLSEAIRARSITVRCSKCQHSCWLDAANAPKNVTPVCLSCAIASGIVSRNQAFASREVLDEVKANVTQQVRIDYLRFLRKR